MLNRFLLLLLTLSLGACSFIGGDKISDFTDRSTGYGWLNIKDVDANRLHSVILYQHQPKTKTPYYHLVVKRFKGGVLFYTHALPNGSFKLYSAEGQSCLGFVCSNTIYTYSFGKQGDDIGTAIVQTPNVYHFGSYKLEEVKTGFFEQDKFQVTADSNAPTNEELLEEVLKDAPKSHPIIAQRIQKAIK